ncbi:outer membrane protein assembly factor BamB family protein [Actinoplanes sp. HUAS TT8]|uniref:outer membrane protein assembly factor BamB family protein n=1 Tax=Actinoplanes sp. HUAS TT8 TaxID=3447453 RepID=UPI003F51EC2C
MGAEAFVIDLGLGRGDSEAAYERPWRETVPRWFTPVLVVVLLLLGSGASAAPAKPPFSALLRITLGPADPYLITGAGRLLTQTNGLITAYDLGTGTLRWQAGQSTPVYRLRIGEGLVLMQPWTTTGASDSTSAISVATGAKVWDNPRSVITFTGSDTLLAVTGTRSLSGTNRRVQGLIEVLDPGTGQARWQVRVPSTAVVLGVPGPADSGTRMLMVRDDRTARLFDLSDGRQMNVRELPAANYGPENPVVAGGVVLLRHPGPSGMEVSAYDPVTLRELWTMPADGTYEVRSCGLLACFLGQDGVSAVDPSTGDRRWAEAGWQAVTERGSALLAYPDSDISRPVGLVDSATGRVRVDLRGWLPMPGSDSSGDLLVTREVPAGARTMVAVADQVAGRVRPIALLPEDTGDCEAAPGRLVCRSTTGELVVWAYDEAAGAG